MRWKHTHLFLSNQFDVLKNPQKMVRHTLGYLQIWLIDRKISCAGKKTHVLFKKEVGIYLKQNMSVNSNYILNSFGGKMSKSRFSGPKNVATKAQLISEWLLHVFIWTKKTNERISALAYKMGQIIKIMVHYHLSCYNI